MVSVLLLSAALVAAPVSSEVTAPGPLAPLAGTMIDAGKGAPVVLVIPGSGPTDRDGNNPLGVTAASYRLLAEGLAAKGISSVRIDKRGMFGSKAAIADPNKVTIADYATDARNWVKAVRARTGAKCVWLLGHSEGSLVALAAAQGAEGVCGVVSVSGAGRKLGDVMRAQLRANPANAPILDPALKAIDALEAGKDVAPAELPGPLAMVFAPPVQGYLKDLLPKDPARLAASLSVPLLVVQGETDLQTSVEDARALAAAQPKAKLVLVPGVNHVLKAAPLDRAANLAAYADPSLPVAPAVVEAIAGFVKG
ncbi:alpha/beta hydrolase [Sphingomonas astaxanthinifaciens]|uniref:Alpha/beta hydrolase n=1 Tax=Sphingomonas astaxanthinifaciens DSM 22298 TaxID=1123267 RepID=A0ABQ5Z6F3_9SPHN|nr:alpha/beta hydrolase [Sphingomonas astaxanthinifaciens]GLR47582.1 alpha/beta hydrolase [Sphingomonas astaxanthinifaciens DSM 22298]